MEFRKQLAFILIACLCSVRCFPSRPLNDRPSELTWQHWLFVDSQNQLQNESDRRITPKSVFIAPKLGQRNDSLPDCAEGYRADAMGRCVKLVKVDEAAQLNFILQRLNEMFAAEALEETEEETDEYAPTAGPLQVNIPLGHSDEADSADVSVVEAIVNGQFDDKVNVKRHQDTKEISKDQTNKNQFDTDEDYEEESTDEIETTTQTEQTTVTEITTEETTTSTTEEQETTEMGTTIIPDVDDDLKALFFRMPTTDDSSENKNSTEINAEESNNIKIKQAPSTLIKEEIIVEPAESIVQKMSTIIQPVEYHQTEKSHLKFPDDKPVKFPVITSSNENKNPTVIENIRDYGNVEQIKQHSGELTSSQIDEFFKHFVNRPPTYIDRPSASHEQVYNHRNRDRNGDLWNLTPGLRDDFQKPLVRYGRYPTPYSPQSFYNPKHISPQHEIQYYGDEAALGYSNVYGRTRRRGSLR